MRGLFDKAILEERAGWIWDFVRMGFSTLALVFRFGYGLRKVLFRIGLKRRKRVSVPVISVGNITVGGTGKTPTVEWLARYLLELGVKPAVLTRGFGKTKDGSDDERFSDPLLEREVPRYVDPKRTRSAKKAIRAGADVLILDDGFQHWQLERDLDLVLIDSLRPWGKDAVLPRGLLREPLTALDRADVVMLTRTDRADPGEIRGIEVRLDRLCPEAPVVHAAHRPVDWRLLNDSKSRGLDELRGRKAVLVSGIGNPYAFQRTARALRVEVARHRAFPDHHSFTAREMKSVQADAAEFMADLILTTEKDARRMPEKNLTPPCAYVRIELEIRKNRQALENLIRDLFPSLGVSSPSPSPVTEPTAP